MSRPDKDPYPLATDWQALARLIANVYYVDGPSYSMDGTYFSHPLPQALHSLVFSVMTGTCHSGMEFLTLLRKSNKKVLSIESHTTFRAAFAVDGGYVPPLRGDFLKCFESLIAPYYRERLLMQCDAELVIRPTHSPIIIPTASGDGQHRVSDASDTLPKARAAVLGFLVDNVIFPTLRENGFTIADEVLKRTLVTDYGLPPELFSVDLPQQSGRKRDYTGQKFGRLYVLNESKDRSKGGHVLWDCICDCGTLVPGVNSSDLTMWRRFSCGECYQKSINEATITKATTQAKQAFYGASVSCVKRATDHAEKVASREFDRNGSQNYDTFLYNKKQLINDSLMLLSNPSMVLAVAGLPIQYTPQEDKDRGTFDLHRVGHERLISRSPMLPYATSTICWVPSKVNKAHLADCTITPYHDGPPEIRGKARQSDADAAELL